VSVTNIRMLSAIAAIFVAAATTNVYSQAQLLACTEIQNITNTPAVTSTPQSVAVQTQTTLSCPVSSDPTIVFGNATSTLVNPSLSCSTILGIPAPTFTRTFLWNNGQQSTFTYKEDLIDVGVVSVVVLSGLITSGEFQGSSAQSIVTFPAINKLLCGIGDSSISALSGVGTFVIDPIL